MATFVIGGKDRVIRPLNFHWMEAAWPALQSILNQPEPATEEERQRLLNDTFGETITAILKVVEQGLDQERELTIIEAEDKGEPLEVMPPPAPTLDRLRKVLRPDEVERLHEPIFDLLRESGMQLGEKAPVGDKEAAGADASTGAPTG